MVPVFFIVVFSDIPSFLDVVVASDVEADKKEEAGTNCAGPSLVKPPLFFEKDRFCLLDPPNPIKSSGYS